MITIELTRFRVSDELADELLAARPGTARFFAAIAELVSAEEGTKVEVTD